MDQNKPDILNVKRELNKLFFILNYNKILFSTLFSSIFIICIYIAFSIPNTYVATATLAPSNPDGDINSEIISPLASLRIPGANLPGASFKSVEALEKIESYDFFSTYFLPNIKLENLMAVKKWNSKNNTLIYDGNKFDLNSGEWVSYSNQNKKKPSIQEAYKTYKNILSINQDERSSFVTISIKHISPIIAQKWTDTIIRLINESMREYDKSVAQSAINFLNNSSNYTNIQAVRDGITALLENEMKTLMLASSNEFYVFKIIDAPVVSEEKSSPNRTAICIFGFLFSIFLSILFVIFRNYFYQKDIINY